MTRLPGQSNPAAAPSPSRKEGVSDGPRFRWKDLTVYLGFALVFAFFAVTIGDKGFLSAQNATSIVSQVTPIALMAFGAVFVLTAGEIDLSIGSVVAMAALFTALGLRHYGLVPGIAFGILTGIVAGLLNGLLIVGLRVPSFLVTLGTMQLFTGIAQISTQLQDVPIVNEPIRTCSARARSGRCPTQWFGSSSAFWSPRSPSRISPSAGA